MLPEIEALKKLAGQRIFKSRIQAIQKAHTDAYALFERLHPQSPDEQATKDFERALAVVESSLEGLASAISLLEMAHSKDDNGIATFAIKDELAQTASALDAIMPSAFVGDSRAADDETHLIEWLRAPRRTISTDDGDPLKQTLLSAAATRSFITIFYRGGTPGHRQKIQPRQLFSVLGYDHDYVEAYSYNHSEIRTFRLDKIALKMQTAHQVQSNPPGSIDLLLAKVCVNCPVCRRARKKQRGAAFWLTSKVENHLCPFCRAYARVYHRKPHEPLPG